MSEKKLTISGEIKDEVIYKINNETLSCKFTPDEKMFLLKLTMKDCSEDIRICLNDYLSKDKDKKKYVLLEIKYSKNFLTFFRTFVVRCWTNSEMLWPQNEEKDALHGTRTTYLLLCGQMS